MTFSHPLRSMMDRKRSILLDGAMGTELQRRGAETPVPLWSAQALQSDLELVAQIHRDYIKAGADIITSNTFRTTPRTFRSAGLPDDSQRLTDLAMTLARYVRSEFPARTILIAGSMAPLEDCYHPERMTDHESLRAEHEEQAKRLAAAGADFLLIETMNTITEAVAATQAAVATGKEVAVSFLCDHNGHLYNGESLEAAVGEVIRHGAAAVSVNCAPPEAIDLALTIIANVSTVPFGAYANVGIAGHEHSDELVPACSADEYVRWVRRWKSLGAALIGGCCGTTPDYIARIADL